MNQIKQKQEIRVKKAPIWPLFLWKTYGRSFKTSGQPIIGCQKILGPRGPKTYSILNCKDFERSFESV